MSCDLCEAKVCKSCVSFLDEETFAFRTEVGAELKHTHYCPNCFESRVAPEIATYQENLEKARGVYIFFKSQKRPPPILTRSKRVMRVAACPDRDETILRLAFQAAELGFNAVIETDVISKKVRNEAYQKLSWQGTGEPAKVDEGRMERENQYEAFDRFR